MLSQLHLFSIGLAAENKPLDSRHLNVTPTETMTAFDGEINFAPEDKRIKGQDNQGRSYEIATTEDASLTAEWLPFGSNRVTPPDIRRGEQVALYRFADTDQYFWKELGLRDNLRRLETVIYAFNANPNPTDGKGIDISTCYFLEVSAHRKMITLGTSKANGEPFTYTLQFNLAEGKVALEDDIGNLFYLDSAETLIEMTNASGTTFQLDRENIYAFCHNNLDFTVGNDATFKIGNDFRITAGGAYSVVAQKTATVEGKAGAALIGGGSSFVLKDGGTTLSTPKFSGSS